MRPGRHFWCGLLLDSEVDSKLSCFGPPPWGLQPDKLWAFYSNWKTLLVSFIFTPFTMFGHMHTCHVLTILPFLKEKPSSVPIVLEADPVSSLIVMHMVLDKKILFHSIMQKISTNKN